MRDALAIAAFSLCCALLIAAGDPFGAGGTLCLLMAAAGLLLAWRAYRRDEDRPQPPNDRRQAPKAAPAPSAQPRPLGDDRADVSRFLASVSHDLRTPLNGMLGLAELLRSEGLGARPTWYADAIHRSGGTLLRLVNDILEFSKLESGHLDLEHTPFSPQEVLEQALLLVAPIANERGLELVGDISPETPDTLMGDPGRIEQVLHNLLGNALKFTERGEVVLTVQPFEQDSSSPGDRRCPLQISVRDTGIGIPEDRQAIIFDAYRQAEANTTRRFGGTGLGLAIVSQLVRAMGGTVDVRSVVDEGTEFVVQIPMDRAPDAVAAPDPRAALDGRRILVLLANDAAREALARLLRGLGAEVCVATSGASAVASASDSTFDAAFVDADLPAPAGGDPWAAVLKRAGGDSLDVNLLTREPPTPDELLSADVDIDGWLVKPATRSAVLRVLEGQREFAAHPGDTGSAVSSARLELPHGMQDIEAPPTGLRVLVAEDQPTNRQVARLMLERLGHRATFAEDGAVAVEKRKTDSFDVILMDRQMPRMDGVEATRRIRAWEERERVHPIVIIGLTAHALVEEKAVAFNAGMNAYLTKPVRLERLGATLREHAPVRRSRSHVESALEPEGTTSRPATPRTVSVRPIAGVLSPEGLELLMSIPAGAARRDIVLTFAESTRQRLTRLPGALEAEDVDEVGAIAHAIKGSSLSMGADALGQIADEIERLARSGALPAVPELLPPLNEAATAAFAALNRLVAEDGDEVAVRSA